MSWIFAALHPPDAPRPRSFPHDRPLFTFDEAGVYVAVGGLPGTACGGHFPPDTQPYVGWAVVGVGIDVAAPRARFLTSEEWSRRLARPEPDLAALDGHFVALRWGTDRLECRTDALGLRTISAATRNKTTWISTRLDWLAQSAGGLAIDFEAYGSFWLALNQLSTRSILRGVQRVPPGGVARCCAGRVEINETPFTPPAASVADLDEAEALLHRLVNLETPGRSRLSLGLSGGLDSRVLLALMRAEYDPVLHVFGDADEPDAMMAARIAAALDLDLKQYPILDFEPESVVKSLRAFAVRTCATLPASTVFRLGPYARLHQEHRIVIDGGMGEIARRRFMKRLRGLRLERIGADEAPELLPYFRGPRPSLFHVDVQAVMKAGFRDDLRALWASLPPVREIGRDDFVDLLTLRTRFPNQSSYEQARLDERIVGFMPYAQPSFIRCLFYTGADPRKSRRFFRDIIRRRNPALAAFPLVKGRSVYPFRLPDLAAAVWTRVLSRPQAVPRETTRQRLLATLKPFILDLAHSEDVDAFEAYDPASVRTLVTRYYDGEGAYEGAVDWWLAFELWRHSIQAPHL